MEFNVTTQQEQQMKYHVPYNTTTYVVRPTPFQHGGIWEVVNEEFGDQQFFVYLTDALMYAEGVDNIDSLSHEARQYWNRVATS